MSGPKQDSSDTDPKAVPSALLHLDLDQVHAIAVTGVRRAAAFLAVGLNSTKGDELPSLALSGESMWRFFPEPAPEPLVRDAIAEFRVWVIGNALRELDAHFNRFLDQVWGAIQWGKLHGQRVKSDFKPDDISADTNTSKKFAMIMKEIGGDDAEAGRLWTLTNARNCLTHSAGIVAERHCNPDAQMRVIWMRLESRLRQGDREVIIRPVFGPEGLKAPDPTKEAEIVIVWVEREKIVQIGHPLVMEPNELHEICFYYLHLSDLVKSTLTAFFTAAGLAMRAVSAAAETATGD